MKESDIGADEDEGSRLSIRVAIDGDTKRLYRMGCVGGLGHAIRASIVFNGRDGKPMELSARLLAFIDPSTGKANVRLGMFDTSKGPRGTEVGQQLVWESDDQCVLVGVDDGQG